MPADTAGFASSGVPELQRQVAELTKELLARKEGESFALQREAAFEEILSAINDPQADVARIFSLVIERATKLCSAAYGYIWLYDGERARPAASFAQRPFSDWLQHRESVPNEITPLGEALLHHRLVHVVDATAHEGYRRHAGFRELVDRGSVRTLLHVPLRKGENLLGVITVYRQERHPFSDSQIALMQGFAAQAVIAMENARLLNAQREALEQQTATAEVLQVINASPGQLEPVFNVMLEKAMALCGAAFGFLTSYDGQRFSPVAMRGVPPSLAEYFARGMDQPSPGEAHHRILQGEDVIHNLDQRAEDAYLAGLPLRRAVVDLGGARSALVVALRKDGAVLGALTIYRKEVRPFSDNEIELMRSFAAQAVIAIENVRLFNELQSSNDGLKEALDKQTATSDILRVISGSPTNVEPVFKTILANANTLCNASFSLLWLWEGEALRAVAHEHVNVSPKLAEFIATARPGPHPHTPLGLSVLERTVVHVEDVLADPRFVPDEVPIYRLEGARSILAVPMFREGILVGVINIWRREPGAFTDGQKALVQTFADQAVIAVENVRLFRELEKRNADLTEALEQQTATSEVLKAISHSAFDLGPVFEAVVENAVKLCDAERAFLFRFDGRLLRAAASYNASPTLREWVHNNPIAPGRQSISARAALEQRTVHVPDVQADPEYGYALRDSDPIGTILAVPMLKGDNLIGTITIYKLKVSPFTDKQIALVETFAAQAVIAIENVRLLTELRESLEQQTATGEILRVIAQSPTDVKPVLDAVANAALRFCGANDVQVCLREAEQWFVAVHLGPLGSKVGERRILDRQTGPGRAITDGKTVHLADVQGLDPVEFAEARKLGTALGFNSALCAPMMRDEVAIGGISLRRPQTGSFSERQIALLESFAAQAVIAIENVRLFTELREALEQQTATADILRVISQSPTDVGPVLKEVAKAALKFCNARDALVALRDGDRWVVAAHEGPIDAPAGLARPLNRASVPGRAILDSDVVQVTDFQSAEADEFPLGREISALRGFRAALAAPLLLDKRAVGAISLRRTEPGAFTPNQVELLKSFAAQAVIAIENVRLFTQLRDSLERLKAAQANLIQAEKMASLGQLTAGIAHEIKNPLNFVNNFAGLSNELLDELKQAVDPLLGRDDDKRAEVQETMELLNSNLAKIVEHGKRADGIVKSMLSHSRGGSGDWQESNINTLVEEALNLAYHGARAQEKDFNITLARDLPRAVGPIEVVPQDITRVFLNLFGNAFYATRKRASGTADAGYRPTLDVSTRDLGEAVEIRVRDNGTGIRSDVRAKLFQPFFTTKPTGEGTGLGLSISYDIVTQQHGGTIEVESEPGSFTEFTIRLPRGRRGAQSRGAT